MTLRKRAWLLAVTVMVLAVLLWTPATSRRSESLPYDWPPAADVEPQRKSARTKPSAYRAPKKRSVSFDDLHAVYCDLHAIVQSGVLDEKRNAAISWVMSCLAMTPATISTLRDTWSSSQ